MMTPESGRDEMALGFLETVLWRFGSFLLLLRFVYGMLRAAVVQPSTASTKHW